MNNELRHNKARPRKQSVLHDDETKVIQSNLTNTKTAREEQPRQSIFAPLESQLLSSFFLKTTKIHGIIPASAQSFLGEAACQWYDQKRSSYSM